MIKLASMFLFRKLFYVKWGLCFLLIVFPFAAYGTPSLSVEISAIPLSGKAPLNDVDLKAIVSGTAAGDITYKFDCRNNDSWEKTETTGNTSYTAVDLCDYPSAGNYTAKFFVERENLTFQGTIDIMVTADGVALLVEKKARNITKNQDTFKKSITADPSDNIEFQIKVTSVGKNIAEDVIVQDTLPNFLIYKGDLKIDGISSAGDILSGFETEIGDLSSGQSKTITFEAEIVSKEKFNFGMTTLINTAIVYNDKIAVTDTTTVNVKKEGTSGAATGVSTGFFDLSTLAFIITFLIGFLLTYLLLLRFYVTKHVMPKAFQAKVERDLLRKITRIREGEKRI